MDAGFEVAVAGEDCRSDKVVVGDRLLDFGVERTGVSDAGGAAVTDGLEAELIEVGLEVGLLKVRGDDARTGGERGLHGRIHEESCLDGLFCKQSGREHDTRVAGVGAAGDRGDQDTAVADRALTPVEGRLGHRGDGVGRRAVADHLLLVGGNGRVASGDERFRGDGCTLLAVAALGDRLGEEALEERLELGKVNPVLGALRSGDARNNG